MKIFGFIIFEKTDTEEEEKYKAWDLERERKYKERLCVWENIPNCDNSSNPVRAHLQFEGKKECHIYMEKTVCYYGHSGPTQKKKKEKFGTPMPGRVIK